jgi:hypothetical protein
MQTYYICDVDNYGQRVGTYTEVQLDDSQVTLDRFGNKTLNGTFLYESVEDVIISCQN